MLPPSFELYTIMADLFAHSLLELISTSNSRYQRLSKTGHSGRMSHRDYQRLVKLVVQSVDTLKDAKMPSYLLRASNNKKCYN